jgi:hypothetical protein
VLGQGRRADQVGNGNRVRSGLVRYDLLPMSQVAHNKLGLLDSWLLCGESRGRRFLVEVFLEATVKVVRLVGVELLHRLTATGVGA